MAVTTDIAATYRGPRRVIRRLLSLGQREDRALVFLMAACGVIFIGQWPRLAREAHVTGADLQMLIGGTLLGWVFIAPLFFYLLAALGHLVARLLGGTGSWYGARLALFWALLASSPLALLSGLVAGFIGPGAQLQLVGSLWVAVLLWFWVAGMLEAEGRESAA